jgi:Fe-S cluster assembly ATP-binding protein
VTIDINDLHVTADKKEILRGLNLQIKSGEIHALMGPNGSGKSTLANVIAGNGEYRVTKGELRIRNYELGITKSKNPKIQRSKNFMLDLLKMKADERARQGVFLSFQNPPVITGVEVGNFLRQVYLAENQREDQGKQGEKKGQRDQGNRSGKKLLSLGDFRMHVLGLMKRLALKPEIYSSTLNETMSGGEKKKLEILQMIILQPRFVILDEIDSGLDVDALKIICLEINRYTKENLDALFLIISHYNRIFSYIKPNFVHVMKEGKIVKSGGSELVEEVEKTGYVNL